MFLYAFGRLLAEAMGCQLSAEPLPEFPATSEPVTGKLLDGPLTKLTYIDCPNFDDLVKAGHPVFVNAYVQQISYYAAHRDKIRRWFTPEPYDPTPFQTGPEDLVVNVRLEDYLELGWALTPSYYLKLIATIPHKRLIITTDTPNSNYFKAFHQFAPEIIHGDTMNDLKWLLNAKRLIISQSSFSWWGAWLADAEVWMPQTETGCWSVGSPTDLVVQDPNWHVVQAQTVRRKHPYHDV